MIGPPTAPAHPLDALGAGLGVYIESVRDYAIFLVDPEGRVATWNLGAERIKGYRADEILGQPISRFYTPEDAAAGRSARLLRAAREEGRAEVEAWRVRKDGTRFWANVVVTRIDGADGRVVGFVKVTRDMTERRAAEEALAARARQQAAVAALGLEALGTRDLQAVQDRAVRIVAETLGLDLVSLLELQPGGESLLLRAGVGWRDGMVGRARVAAVPGTLAWVTLCAQAPVVIEDLATDPRFPVPTLAQSAGAASGLAVLVRAPAAPDRPYGIFGAFSRGKRGFSPDDVHFAQAVANVLATAVARRQAEEQLARAEQTAEAERGRARRAREAVRERDAFIALTAHELRTPLTALQLKLQGLGRLLARSETARAEPVLAARLDGALQQTRRLGALVERLVDVSRIVSGRLEITRSPVDLAALAAEVAEEQREVARRAGTELRLHARAPVVGRWDRERVRQVIAGVLANAVRYGAGQPVDVRVEATPAGAELSVADRGIGIAADDLARIFGRFERAAPVEHYGGLGLGLFIARHVVEAHGGTIRVESAPGQGATFTMVLPR